MHGMAHDLVSCIRWDPHPQAIQKKEGFIRESGAAKWWYSADIPSGYVNSLLLKMAIEIVSFTINSMVMFHSYVKVYQRVVFFANTFRATPKWFSTRGSGHRWLGHFFSPAWVSTLRGEGIDETQNFKMSPRWESYTVVNIQKLWKITIFNGKIHYKWAIFNSYVKLPEGSQMWRFCLEILPMTDPCMVYMC